MIVISASVVKCRRNLFKETRMSLHRRTTDEICRSQVSDWSRVTPSSLIVFEDWIWKVLSENVKVKSEVFCRDCLVGMHRINYPAGISGRIVNFSTIRYPAG